MRRACPSASTISIASTQLRTLPHRTDRGPAALVATMPPEVANAPEDGSGGRRRPKGRAAAVSSVHVTEAPAHCLRRGQSGAAQWNPWLRSTTAPCATHPPAIPLPAPRGTSRGPIAAAHLTCAVTYATPRGPATAVETV